MSFKYISLRPNGIPNYNYITFFLLYKIISKILMGFIEKNSCVAQSYLSLKIFVII